MEVLQMSSQEYVCQNWGISSANGFPWLVSIGRY